MINNKRCRTCNNNTTMMCAFVSSLCLEPSTYLSISFSVVACIKYDLNAAHFTNGKWWQVYVIALAKLKLHKIERKDTGTHFKRNKNENWEEVKIIQSAYLMNECIKRCVGKTEIRAQWQDNEGFNENSIIHSNFHFSSA